VPGELGHLVGAEAPKARGARSREGGRDEVRDGSREFRGDGPLNGQGPEGQHGEDGGREAAEAPRICQYVLEKGHLG
jgi:hypothetical protein